LLPISCGMILVTGGAGFIGSYLQAELFARGHETVIADRLGAKGKWRNIARHPPSRIVAQDDLEDFLDSNPPIEAVVHMGAISETLAVDGDQVWRTNVELSQKLWAFCAHHGARFIYASSAATYGDGQAGFDDDPLLLGRLEPMNLYGWSKHVFDLQVMDMLRRHVRPPPQWAGLKFFNVYGPNEYHKGPMVSVVKVKYDEIEAGLPATLFRSTHPDIPDGGQSRDFIWVGDVVDVMLWLLDTPSVSGLFNVGTGVARSYLDLAHAVADAAGVPRAVEFVDMPEVLRPQYQSFTCARTERLRAAGYTKAFTRLEDGVGRYVRDFLSQANPYK
jgi:ADP-L-glycero-D-manno-heptose 6-epimerase